MYSLIYLFCNSEEVISIVVEDVCCFCKDVLLDCILPSVSVLDSVKLSVVSFCIVLVCVE